MSGDLRFRICLSGVFPAGGIWLRLVGKAPDFAKKWLFLAEFGQPAVCNSFVFEGPDR
jgi:hypothetical protein